MTEDQAAQADAAIRVGFKYIAPTDKNYEGFGDSHLPAVLAGQPWTGDCDNLAATFLDYCRQECGAALEDLFEMIVCAPVNGVVPDPPVTNHCIACVYIRNAGTAPSPADPDAIFIGGDTFGTLYASSTLWQVGHKPIKYRCLAETFWRDGAPFG